MFASARLTRHALAAMARRGITEQNVRGVLASPEAVLAGDRPDRRIAQGRVRMGDPPRPMLLRAVVDIGVSPPEVVTVYATTQFRRYGAES